MIKINHLTFEYKPNSENLSNIDLKIKEGECVLLCGKSGCGKTTVTRLINGLIPHFTEGEIKVGEVYIGEDRVDNLEVYQLAENVGSVFQNPKSQFFNLESEAELAFGLENRGVKMECIRERIDETTKALNIEKLRSRDIFSMSAGEKQSLAFACVYAMNPSIYVLDEPTANLDYKSIQLLKKQMESIKAEGKTILIAEHRIYFLVDLIDRAVYMEDGVIKKIYSRDEFLALNNEERVLMGLRTIENKSTIELDELKMQRLNEKSTKLRSYLNKETIAELDVRNLSFSYNQSNVLSNLSFKVASGEVLGIMGRNGQGKTTLLRCLAGLIKEASGEILFNGKRVNTKERNRLSYLIMQDVNHQLFCNSVWNECSLHDRNIDDETIEAVLSDFDLLRFKDSHPMALSGGQKQRLAIAAGVLCGKKVLLFDEPTSGLDYQHMMAVSYTIKELAKAGHIIIIVTHDMEFLECTCTSRLEI